MTQTTLKTTGQEPSNVDWQSWPAYAHSPEPDSMGDEPSTQELIRDGEYNKFGEPKSAIETLRSKYREAVGTLVAGIALSPPLGAGIGGFVGAGVALAQSPDGLASIYDHAITGGAAMGALAAGVAGTYWAINEYKKAKRAYAEAKRGAQPSFESYTAVNSEPDQTSENSGELTVG